MVAREAGRVEAKTSRDGIPYGGPDMTFDMSSDDESDSQPMAQSCIHGQNV